MGVGYTTYIYTVIIIIINGSKFMCKLFFFFCYTWTEIKGANINLAYILTFILHSTKVLPTPQIFIKSKRRKNNLRTICSNKYYLLKDFKVELTKLCYCCCCQQKK